MSEPRFLSLEEVLELQTRALHRYGGIAAAYAFHIAEAQAFLDGNKRTAIAAALTFLRGNGVALTMDANVLYDAMIAIAEKRMAREQLAEILRGGGRADR